MTPLVLAEARTQPRHVAAMFARGDEFAELAARLRGRFSHVVLVARGSSDNAARYGQYLFGIRNGLSAALATPSVVTRYLATVNLTDALVIAISQSGASQDLAAVVTDAAGQGRPTLAITNDPTSPLAAAAEACLALDVGPERSIAATTTYTASLAALAMLSQALGGGPDRAHGDDERVAVPAAMDAVLDDDAPTAWMADWGAARRGIVVGRGYEFSTAHETALKLQELAGVIAQAHSGADVQHGPIGGLTGEVPVLVLSSVGEVDRDMASTTGQLAERGPVLVIGSAAPEDDGLATWRLPVVAEWLAPLVSVVAGQRLAIDLSYHLGLDPDHPARLTKITRTR